jgi:hypothetical protein
MNKADLNWKTGIVTTWDIDEMDLANSIESQVDLLKEDLMQARFGSKIILDLGWHPEFNPQGHFVLSVIKSGDWENPILQLKFHGWQSFWTS